MLTGCPIERKVAYEAAFDACDRGADYERA